MKRVLIVCTGNSSRSQMAEALWRQQGGRDWEVVSAGVKPAGFVNPMAIEVMAELGISLKGHQSKAITNHADHRFDLLVTVCDRACKRLGALTDRPVVVHHVHWSIPDPFRVEGSPEVRREAYRLCRIDLQRRIRGFFAAEGAAHLDE